MPVGEVGIACRCPVLPVPEQLPDQRQVFAGHDGLTRERVAQIVEPQPPELRLAAHRAPALDEAVQSSALRVLREHEPIGATSAGKRIDLCPGSFAQRHGARSGLAVRQAQGLSRECRADTVRHPVGDFR